MQREQMLAYQYDYARDAGTIKAAYRQRGEGKPRRDSGSFGTAAAPSEKNLE